MTPQAIYQLAASRHLPGGPADLVATHASWILLNDEFAYKIKRPVELSFLDFSTLDQRRHFCRRELVLNRRLAPEIYLQVMTVVQDELGEWRLLAGIEERPAKRQPPRRSRQPQAADAQTGEKRELEPIDYALQMVRLPSEFEMQRLLSAGHIKPRQIKALAVKVASFHKRAETIHHALRTEDLIFAIADLEHVEQELIQMLGINDHRRLWVAVDAAISYIRQQQALLNRRAQAGRRIDGHGDLHAGNIFLTPKGPVIFDCLEFNDDWRWVDVLDELAFLCIDFDFHGKAAWRSQLERAYFRELGEEMGPDETQLFHYFLAYRASVRLKITALRYRQSTDNNRDALIGTAARYSLLTQRYADSLLPVEI